MTTVEIAETNGATAPAPKAATPKKRASGGTKRPKAKAPPKRKAASKTKTTRAGEHGKMAKKGDYAMVVRIPPALHKKMWAWAKKQDDSLSGLVRKAIERLVK